jgi:hypothetical protein
VALNQSILTSVKKALGIEEEYEAFDAEILMYINGAFARLNQLGVGPELGFRIEDKTVTWDAFLGSDLRLDNVKTYVSLKAKSTFDPPGTSFGLQAMKEQIDMLEWTINAYRELTGWTDPDPDEVDEDDDIFIDGGGA